jgi:hypothetical protein
MAETIDLLRDRRPRTRNKLGALTHKTQAIIRHA